MSKLAWCTHSNFAGLVNEVDLAAVSVENSVIAGLAFGVMVHFLP
jgi:hypothetical protein